MLFFSLSVSDLISHLLIFLSFLFQNALKARGPGVVERQVQIAGPAVPAHMLEQALDAAEAAQKELETQLQVCFL